MVGDADPDGWVTFTDVPNEPTFDLPVEISTVGAVCGIWAEFGNAVVYFTVERSTVLPDDLRLYYARGSCTPPNCSLMVGGTATYNASRQNAHLVVESYDGVHRWKTPIDRAAGSTIGSAGGESRMRSATGRRRRCEPDCEEAATTLRSGYRSGVPACR